MIIPVSNDDGQIVGLYEILDAGDVVNTSKSFLKTDLDKRSEEWLPTMKELLPTHDLLGLSFVYESEQVITEKRLFCRKARYAYREAVMKPTIVTKKGATP